MLAVCIPPAAKRTVLNDLISVSFCSTVKCLWLAKLKSAELTA